MFITFNGILVNVGAVCKCTMKRGKVIMHLMDKSTIETEYTSYEEFSFHWQAKLVEMAQAGAQVGMDMAKDSLNEFMDDDENWKKGL